MEFFCPDLGLGSIDLDLIIDKVNKGFEVKEQEEGTCYANVVAAVLHLATKRILERVEGYPDFFTLRDKLIKKYGVHGANTLHVLGEVCPEYRLHYQEVDTKGAFEAITGKRPVIALFYLTKLEWDQFSYFYIKEPEGTLSKKDLDITKRDPGISTSGHAVVLTSFNKESGLTLMNSWGSHWANKGFFSVENANVIGLKFVDVYWTLNDLHPSEITAYEQPFKSKNTKPLFPNSQNIIGNLLDRLFR